MTEALRRAYLEAMDIDVWVVRDRGAEQPRLHVSPGQGRCLLVCSRAEDSASRLAADLVRVLGGDGRWAWPAEDGLTLGEAVADRLAVLVLIFGRTAARELLGNDPPDTLGSAAVVVAASVDELAASADARRSLWRALCRVGALPRPAARVL